MTKTKKLTVATALLVTATTCAVSGGLLWHKSQAAFAEISYTIVSEEGDRIAYGAGWGEQASAKVVDAFQAEGIAKSEITLYKADTLGDAVVFAAEKENEVYIYNVLNEAVYSVNKIDNLAAIIRVIGAPVGEAVTDVTVSGYGYEYGRTGNNGATVNVTSGTNVQLFETGIIVGNKVYVGVIENTGTNTYKMHPLIDDQDVLAKDASNKAADRLKIVVNNTNLYWVGDIDGTWHALKSARTKRNDKGNLVVNYNFRAGCIEVVYNSDWSLSSRMAYAGQNFDKDGNPVNLPVENYTTDEHLWTGCAGDALSYYKNFHPEATENDLKDVFRTGYLNMVQPSSEYEHSIIPGYRCSDIKMWDDLLVVDYKYSPQSQYGFDGPGTAGRERMYTLVYSTVQDKVYGVGDRYFKAWKENSDRVQYGAPISNVMYDFEIAGTTYAEIQLFEKGYMYCSTVGGKVSTQPGTTTDKDYQGFRQEASPAAPSEYGAQKEKIEVTENGKTVYYFNYQKGVAKATEMATKSGYLYDYYPGRNYNKADKSIKLLDYDTLYGPGAFYMTPDKLANFPGHWESGWNEDHTDKYVGVKDKLEAKVKQLLNAGYFPGFPNDDFRPWNGASGTSQLIYGDSMANPFGSNDRTNVSVIIWNSTLNEVFLVKDAFMTLWDKKHDDLGEPLSDEYSLSSAKDIIFQDFEGTSENKTFAVATGYNEAAYFVPDDDDDEPMTPQKYLADLKELSRPLTSVKLILEDFDLTVDGYASFDIEVVGNMADATVTFSSSDTNIGVFEDSSYGEVDFYKKGKVTITVTITSGNITVKDSVTLTVK